MKKATYGEVCTTCDDTRYLTCNAGNYCVCQGDLFWNGTFCGKFCKHLHVFFLHICINYFFSVTKLTDGLSCKNSWDCDATVGLWCDNITSICV